MKNLSCPKCESLKTQKAGAFFFAIGGMFCFSGTLLLWIPQVSMFLFIFAGLFLLATFSNIFLKNKIYYCRECHHVWQNK